MRKRTISMMGLALVGVAASSCGGGGSAVTSGYPDPGTTTNLPSGPSIVGGTAMRLYKGGESYVYNVTGTVTQEYLDTALTKRTITAPVTGTLIRTVNAVTFNGLACFQVRDNLTFTPRGGVPYVRLYDRYVTQAADGSLTQVGQRDNSTSFSTPGSSAFLPGTFGAGVGLAGTNTFANLASDPTSSKTVVNSFTILAADNVTATSGVHSTWKVSTSRSDTSDYDPIARVALDIIMPKGFVVHSVHSDSGTEWWTPSISAPVQMAYTIDETNTVLTSWTYTSGTFTRTDDILRTNGSITVALQSYTIN